MTNTTRHLRRISVAGLALASLFGVLAATDARAASTKCKRIRGTVMLTPSTDPGCTSPVSVCATGELSGDLAGSSAFIGSSLVPTVDTSATATVLLTGDNRITTRRGVLFTKDAVVLRTTGEGAFAEVDTIVGGTGKWAGATGVFTAVGTYDAASGGEGTYEGEVCVP